MNKYSPSRFITLVYFFSVSVILLLLLLVVMNENFAAGRFMNREAPENTQCSLRDVMHLGRLGRNISKGQHVLWMETITQNKPSVILPGHYLDRLV